MSCWTPALLPCSHKVQIPPVGGSLMPGNGLTLGEGSPGKGQPLGQGPFPHGILPSLRLSLESVPLLSARLLIIVYTPVRCNHLRGSVWRQGRVQPRERIRRLVSQLSPGLPAAAVVTQKYDCPPTLDRFPSTHCQILGSF